MSLKSTMLRGRPLQRPFHIPEGNSQVWNLTEQLLEARFDYKHSSKVRVNKVRVGKTRFEVSEWMLSAMERLEM